MHPIDETIIAGFSQPAKKQIAPFRRFGGKGRLANWIVGFLPNKMPLYVEPFAGAASVFWALPDDAFGVAVLNDLDSDIVNAFRCLQDPSKFETLAHRLVWTPHARAEYVRARRILAAPDANEIDRAWALIVASCQGFAGEFSHDGQWGRSFSNERTTALRNRIGRLLSWHDRLTRAQIDNRDAIECIKYWDTPNTTFYCDPPYVGDMRTSTSNYRHETTDALHESLVATLLDVEGLAILSCYWCDIYTPLIDAGWTRIDRTRGCDAAGRTRGAKLQGKGGATEHAKRTETLLLSPRLLAGQPRRLLP